MTDAANLPFELGVDQSGLYISRAELVDRYGEREIANLERNIDDQQATVTAIADGTALINSYIGAQYALPLPSIPKSLKDANAVIARYKLHKTKRPDDLRQDYEDLIKWLDKIASSKIALLDDDNQRIPLKPAPTQSTMPMSIGVMVV